MDAILLQAILAMDAYNRGYDQGVTGLEGTSIGSATVIQQSGTAAGTPGFDASFYAIAYQLADGSSSSTDHSKGRNV
ncbi:MAG: hypothetical protein ABL893_03350, partial [Hyphomicrobium sp.]